jgi:ABC-type antimicrobial peptide transport system permease subunit
MGMEDPEMGDEQPQGPSGLKSIQRLTGKLSQKIRAFDKDKGLDSQDIKYVINSILSSIDLDNLDEDDKDDILSKFEDSDEYGMEGEGDLDLSGEDDMSDFDMEEPEMGMEEPEMGMEEPAPVENFKESVEDVLSKYFVVTDEEKKLHEEKNKKNFIKNKLVNIEVKNEIERMSESVKQMNTAKRFLNENVNAKFIGKTNKQNLVFSVNGKNIKVNTTGNII